MSMHTTFLPGFQESVRPAPRRGRQAHPCLMTFDSLQALTTLTSHSHRKASQRLR